MAFAFGGRPSGLFAERARATTIAAAQAVLVEATGAQSTKRVDVWATSVTVAGLVVVRLVVPGPVERPNVRLQ